ncbi:MAG: alkaline phosphatase [Clostridia bacterium]|nr:alkaline phosphatase [Clostridia bacterium]
MKNAMKNLLAGICIVCLLVSFTACADKCPCKINGIGLDKFNIVYSANEPEYNLRAAEYLQKEILSRTGIELSVTDDETRANPFGHEIVVGETNREISADLDAETEAMEFAMLANEKHIALEGDYFVIAAAAYYFVETFITGDAFSVEIKQEATVLAPIQKEAKNFILLIGDGMGVNQTKLFDAFSAEDLKMPSDGEKAFYGYMFPNLGFARTNSLSGVTDSAAAGTALATGYKTHNGYVGKNSNLKDVESLTEIAVGLEKGTAVMSTESSTGATPAAFSAHVDSREDTSGILSDQLKLKKNSKTLILGNYGTVYSQAKFDEAKKEIRETLEKLSAKEKGFFIMYEEAHIDKHSHSNDMTKAFKAVVRFNQAIGAFMEFAFYNPETFVLITADHETGGLTVGENGEFNYTSEDHTGADVPVFAYGVGAEVFNGITVENIQIPKTIAKMWGIELKGYADNLYPAL